MISDDEFFIYVTPPKLVEVASYDLLSMKSRKKYEYAYKQVANNCKYHFTLWK